MNLSRLTGFVAGIPWRGGIGFQQVRNEWQDCRMIRDVKRRRLNAEFYDDRLRVNSLRRNRILPIELREIADKEINEFPLNSTPLRMNKRCAVTSRPRGIVYDWRLSRIVWRHLADYNKLSGVQRAMWSYSPCGKRDEHPGPTSFRGERFPGPIRL